MKLTMGAVLQMSKRRLVKDCGLPEEVPGGGCWGLIRMNLVVGGEFDLPEGRVGCEATRDPKSHSNLTKEATNCTQEMRGRCICRTGVVQTLC